MAIVENNVLIRCKNSNGDSLLMYPITKAENVDGLDDKLAGKANSSHTHAQSDITGLADALAGKANASHGTHVTFSSTAPVVAGTAAVGMATTVARSDHVHPAQTTVSGNAGSATKLQNSRTIDGVSFNGTAAITHFGSCSTAASTAAKTVTCTGFSLITGAEITVKFTVTNTAANPTLNVNNTGAKPIYYRGAAISAGYLAQNRTYRFSYDGTSYNLVGDINTDTNTTYPAATTSVPGLMSAADKSKLDGITTSADAVSFTASATSGNKVGSITINGTKTDMYSPTQSTVSGNAGTATKLQNARTIKTNLGSTTAATFDGSANVAPGVSGTLGLANGGTGATSASAARANIGAAKVFYSADEPDWNVGDVWFQIVT